MNVNRTAVVLMCVSASLVWGSTLMAAPIPAALGVASPVPDNLLLCAVGGILLILGVRRTKT